MTEVMPPPASLMLDGKEVYAMAPPLIRPDDLLATLRQVHVDVRDDIRRGQEPFARIMAAVNALGPRDALALRTPFEPIPLYAVLGKRGFAHWTERRAGDDWTVWFYRNTSAQAAEMPDRDPAPRATTGRTLTIDVRGLEPPHPMVRVLEALEGLKRVTRSRCCTSAGPFSSTRSSTSEASSTRPTSRLRGGCAS
jgi:hypothetical protein